MALGEKASEFLAKHFAESFKREVDADEAIWRSLPFFAALLGLAVAVLPSIYRQASRPPMTWASAPALILFALALLSFVIAGYWFARVIMLRRYRYPPTDAKLLRYANQLDQYYQAFDTTVADRDASVAIDLRASVLSELAAASTENRIHNIARATARSQALIFVMTGFLLAFLAEAIILGREAAALIR